MANYSSTYGLRSGEVARTRVKCEVGPSSEEVVGELSVCNAIADKTIIATILRGHLLSHFGDSLVDGEFTTTGKDISRRIFETVKLMIENVFYNSMDIEISAEVEDELENDTTYEPITKKERRKVSEVSVETIEKSC